MSDVDGGYEEVASEDEMASRLELFGFPYQAINLSIIYVHVLSHSFCYKYLEVQG